MLSGQAVGQINMYDLSGLWPLHRPRQQRGQVLEPLLQLRMPSGGRRGTRADTEPPGVRAVAWYPRDTGLFAAVCGRDVALWDPNAAAVAARFAADAPLRAAAFHDLRAPHTLLAVAGEGPAVRLADLRSAAFTHSLLGHVGPVQALAWNPGADWQLASSGADGGVRLWDVRRPRPLWLCGGGPQAHGGGALALAWVGDGRTLLSTGGDRQLRAWCALSGRALRRTAFQPAPASVAPPTDLAPPLLVSRDAALVLQAWGTRVHTHALRSGAPLQTLSAHLAPITSAALLYAGHEWLFTGGLDRRVLAWGPPSPEPPSRARKRARPQQPVLFDESDEEPDRAGPGDDDDDWYSDTVE